MIFIEFGSSGFRRYSFITILECSIHNFQASFETFSYTRLPISPFHGTRSRPGISRSNFTQCTMRSPGFAGALTAGAGVQDSSAIVDPPKYTKLYLTAQCRKFLGDRKFPGLQIPNVADASAVFAAGVAQFAAAVKERNPL